MDALTRLDLSVFDGVAVVRMMRPEKKNAIDQQMMQELDGVCRFLEAASDIKCVILTGQDNVFCAGGDIHAWGALSAQDFAFTWLRQGHDTFDRLARLRQPVIVVINGLALGGGLELAACADYRIAEAHSRFGLPEPSLGVIAGWSGTQRASRRFGGQAVRRMALFGQQFTADEALQFGLVDQLCDTGAGMDAARALAQRVLAQGALATQITKMMINAAEGEENERVIDTLAGFVVANSGDLAEGLAAFKEKRRPQF